MHRLTFTALVTLRSLPALAATCTVTRIGDSDVGTLRHAMGDANDDIGATRARDDLFCKFKLAANIAATTHVTTRDAQVMPFIRELSRPRFYRQGNMERYASHEHDRARPGVIFAASSALVNGLLLATYRSTALAQAGARQIAAASTQEKRKGHSHSDRAPFSTCGRAVTEQICGVDVRSRPLQAFRGRETSGGHAMNAESMRMNYFRNAALVICAVLGIGQWQHSCAEDSFGAMGRSAVRESTYDRAYVPATAQVVTNCDDSGPGSLRYAVADAASGDIIDLSALTCGTITLTSGAIMTDLDELTLIGPGAAALEIDGSGVDRVVAGGTTTELTLSRLTLINGVVEETDAAGGCLHAAAAFLSEVNVYDCVARATSGTARGGGIATDSALEMDHVTISNCAAESTDGEAQGGGAYAGASLIMDASTLSGNVAQTAPFNPQAGSGGGLFVALGLVSVQNSTISGNAAQFAAGFDLPGSQSNGPIFPIIVNSTITGNSAGIEAGAIRAGRSLRIYNSTIAFNTEPLAPHVGVTHSAGVQLGDFVRLSLESTIIANNHSGPRNLDLNGERSALVVGTHNLVTHSVLALEPGTLKSDPLLQPLQKNGGPTATLSLSAGSPAIGTGSNPLSLTTDQRLRGHPRKLGFKVDVGAVEYGSAFVRGFER